MVAVREAAAFAQRYGGDIQVAGQYSGRLSNGGELLRLEDAAGDLIQEFEYNNTWYAQADGEGYSLEIVDPTNADLDSWSEAQSWRASLQRGGTPGTDEILVSSSGDANRDGKFDQEDINRVLAEGKFENDQAATWEQGDFSGDGLFNFYDMLLALSMGTFQNVASAQSVTQALRSNALSVLAADSQGTARDAAIETHSDEKTDRTLDPPLATDASIPRRVVTRPSTSLATSSAREANIATGAQEDFFEELARSRTTLE